MAVRAPHEDRRERTAKAANSAFKDLADRTIAREPSCAQYNFKNFARPSATIQKFVFFIDLQASYKYPLQIAELALIRLHFALLVNHLEPHSVVVPSDKFVWVVIVKLNIRYFVVR